MISRKWSAVLVFFVLTCALSCLAEGYASLQSMQSCHRQTDTDSEVSKVCCKQAVVDPAFQLFEPLTGTHLELPGLSYDFTNPETGAVIEQRTSPPGIHFLGSLRI
jgi:hypothetical protein